MIITPGGVNTPFRQLSRERDRSTYIGPGHTLLIPQMVAWSRELPRGGSGATATIVVRRKWVFGSTPVVNGQPGRNATQETITRIPVSADPAIVTLMMEADAAMLLENPDIRDNILIGIIPINETV